MSGGSPSTLNEDTREQHPDSVRQEAALVPTLTLALHSDLRRVGQRAHLLGALLGLRVPLSRTAPDFRDTAGQVTGPLRDAFVSRKPLSFAYEDGALWLDASETSDRVSVDGRAAEGRVRIGPEQLARGALIDIAERVLLIAHWTLAEALPAEQRGIVGASEALRRVHAAIQRAAAHDRPVLVLGASGSGKELVSRAIHDSSGRAKRPFVAINMAAIAESMAESQLFGHARGAFTGATGSSLGVFREAHGGSLFMDEVGELAPAIQAKLLRVLETREVRPLGDEPVQVDVRFIAATDADLAAREREGSFKLPLWHRLAAEEIHVPPLSERIDDIARLLVHFLARELGNDAARWFERSHEDRLWLSTAAMAHLLRRPWPGNVRELAHLAARVAAECRGKAEVRTPGALLELLGAGPARPAPVASAKAAAAGVESPPPAQKPRRRHLKDIDDATLVAALRAHQWQIGRTAAHLNISRTSLYLLMEKSPALRNARDIPHDEIVACRARHAGDTEQMAAELEVSERALTLRLRELGL